MSQCNLCLQWMPKRKGLVSGFVVAGFGGGAFIFDQIQTAYINHGNLAANEEIDGEVYVKIVLNLVGPDTPVCAPQGGLIAK